MNISTCHIKELVNSGFMEECNCLTCVTRYPILCHNQYVVYKILDSNCYVIFYQTARDWWDAYYFRDRCIYSGIIPRHISFEEVFDLLPPHIQEIAVFYFDVLLLND